MFFLFVGYRVTCLIIHPINSRATSRTSGAKVVPLEQHTNHQVPRTVSEPCCCSRYTCLCCHSNSMSAECISVSALRQNSCFITMSKIRGKTGSPCPRCENEQNRLRILNFSKQVVQVFHSHQLSGVYLVFPEDLITP